LGAFSEERSIHLNSTSAFTSERFGRLAYDPMPIQETIVPISLNQQLQVVRKLSIGWCFCMGRQIGAVAFLAIIGSLLMLSADGKIITYDSKLGEPPGEVVYDLKVPPEEWYSLPAWSNNGRSLAVTWPIQSRIDHKGFITEVAQKKGENWTGVMHTWGSSGELKKHPMTCSFDSSRTVLLNANTLERLPVSIPVRLFGLLWSPDDKLIVGSFSRPVVYSTLTNEQVFQIPVKRQSNWVKDLAWSPDSKMLASADIAGINVWSMLRGTKVFTMPDLLGKCDSLSWSPDGSLIAAIGGTDEEDDVCTDLRVYDWKKKKVAFKLSATGGFSSAAWSNSAYRKNYFAFADTALHLMSSDLSKEIARLPFPAGGEPKFQWSPDGRYIAYKGNEPDLHIFSVEAMRETLVIAAEPNGIFTFHWSPNSRYLALAGNSQLAICDAQTGNYLGSKRIIDVLPPRWSPDGKSIAVNNYADDSIRLLALNFEPSAIVFTGGASGNPWIGQTRLSCVEDCFDEITKIYDPAYIKRFRECPKEQLHTYTRGMCGIGFGSDLRNMWKLRQHSPLVEYFNRLGIANGENMSDIIIRSYWRHLNNQPIELELQLESARNDELCEQPIIVENKQLSDKFVQAFQLTTTANEKPKTPITVLAFITKGDSTTLKGLVELRNLFSPDQLAIKVVTLTSDLMAYGKERIGKREKVKVEAGEAGDPKGQIGKPGLDGVAPSRDFDQEFDDFLEQHKLDIPSQNGTLAQYELLKEETANRINSNSYGMPQILVIKNGSYLVTRFNYFQIGEEHTKKVRDAIKACLP
jgi:WD40 repeat protein